MFLGISYDKWHGILALLVIGLIFAITLVLIHGIMSPGMEFLTAWLIGFFVAHHLQSWNEARQAIDPMIQFKYGSYEAFQANSLNDWRYFWYGVFLSMFVLGIIASFFL